MQQIKYQKSAIYSAVLHIIIVAFILIGLNFSTSNTSLSNSAANKKVKIVQAVAINQTAVQAEISRLKQQQTAKRAVQQAYQHRLQVNAHAAKQARQREQQRLAKLKQQQLAAAKIQAKKQAAWQAKQKLQQQKAQQAAAKLAVLKQQQSQTQQNLKALKQQQLVMQKQKQLAAQKLAQIKQQQALLAAKKKRLAKRGAFKALQQQMAAEQKQLQTSKKHYVNSIIATYKSLILNAIQQQWVVPYDTNNSLACQLLIKLTVAGKVLSVTVVKSSGDPALDNSARAAVFKASPLPMPRNQQIAPLFHEIQLMVRPEKIHAAHANL